jgi:hypothetical protein
MNVCPKSVSTWLSRALDHSESRIGIRLREDMKEFHIEIDDLSLAEKKKAPRNEEDEDEGA